MRTERLGQDAQSGTTSPCRIKHPMGNTLPEYSLAQSCHQKDQGLAASLSGRRNYAQPQTRSRQAEGCEQRSAAGGNPR